MSIRHSRDIFGSPFVRGTSARIVRILVPPRAGASELIDGMGLGKLRTLRSLQQFEQLVRRGLRHPDLKDAKSPFDELSN
jgi:hypothetical protein